MLCSRQTHALFPLGGYVWVMYANSPLPRDILAYGSLSAVSLIVSRGLPLDTPLRRRWLTPLQFVIARERLSVTKFLLNHCTLHPRTEYYNNVNMATLLLKNGLNPTDSLTSAVLHRHINCIPLFLTTGARVHIHYYNSTDRKRCRIFGLCYCFRSRLRYKTGTGTGTIV